MAAGEIRISMFPMGPGPYPVAGQSGQFTCYGERTDHVLPSAINRCVDSPTRLAFLSNAKVILNLITSGLLERFPKLNFVSVESGIGWIPFILETLDYSLAESGARRQGKLSLSPFEYFRRQIYASFWFEGRDAFSSIRRLGVDNVMFETDFPHPVCLYPRPLEQVRDCLADLTLEERRKVLSENAARVYRISLD